MPCGPLSDDWLFWDPATLHTYPHSCEADAEYGRIDEKRAETGRPEQLELFAEATT